ncbi:hypothetical protein AC249_AIPGENE27174 [Exaiptasia diaphana]|nr:hypothetical protein AC249_AIPGENE27174 [Exaiptasia diaphana]
MAAVYQLKIRFEERNTMVFLEPEDIPFMDLFSLIEKSKCTLPSRYQVLGVDQIRLKYLDDEKCFVELSDDSSIQQYCISEMFRCAVQVENADFKRITLKLEINDSPMLVPCRPVGKRSMITCSNPCPTSLPSKSEKERKTAKQQPKASRRLETLFKPKPAKVSSKSQQLAALAPLSCEQSNSLFKSPLEKYIDHQENNLNALKEKERQLSGWIREYTNLQKSSAVRQTADVPMCGNCHRREKHNRLNCPYHEYDDSSSESSSDDGLLIPNKGKKEVQYNKIHILFLSVFQRKLELDFRKKNEDQMKEREQRLQLEMEERRLFLSLLKDKL